jgi:fluoroacetyl-CoA thioesterase
MELPEFAPGLTARVELTVTDADTAQWLGSGDVPVLGTPRVLALAEAATVAATARQMPGGVTTVGVRAEVEHRAPTPVGRLVTALATLAKVRRWRPRSGSSGWCWTASGSSPRRSATS